MEREPPKKEIPREVATLRALPTVGIGQDTEGFGTVKEFLARFGYLDLGVGAEGVPLRADEHPPEKLDSVTSIALARYQTMHALTPTGIFDEATREMMSRARCGFPDVDPAAPAFSATTCTWNRDAVTYAFGTATNDVAGDGEREPVRRAFATWSAATHFAFREVGTGDNPDILISWTQANCGDANMTGSTLAHADYSPGCGYYGNALPRPLHFDDQENAWAVGAVVDSYDIETVALHEIGHVLGLQHSSVASAVMFPTVSSNTTRRVLDPDDIEGIGRQYKIRGPIFARHSGRCLDIAEISTANGADAVQWDYWGGGNQLFTIEWVEASHFKLIAQHSGRVIDVDAGSRASGAQIHQWDWWGGDNQKFRLDPVGNGYYRVVAKHSGKCLDVSGISPANGPRVVQWDWWGGSNQQWRLGPAAVISRHSGKALDIEGISFANGARAIQWDYWGGANQRFRLDPVGDGYYRIMVENSGKCLDVSGVSRRMAHRSSSGSTGAATTRSGSQSRPETGTTGWSRSTAASAST